VFDEEAALKKATRRSYYLSKKFGRKVAPPTGNPDHWIHQPLRWADTGEPASVKDGDA